MESQPERALIHNGCTGFDTLQTRVEMESQPERALIQFNHIILLLQVNVEMESQPERALIPYALGLHSLATESE